MKEVRKVKPARDLPLGYTCNVLGFMRHGMQMTHTRLRNNVQTSPVFMVPSCFGAPLTSVVRTQQYVLAYSVFMLWHYKVKRPLFIKNALLTKLLTSAFGEDWVRMVKRGGIETTQEQRDILRQYRAVLTFYCKKEFCLIQVTNFLPLTARKIDETGTFH